MTALDYINSAVVLTTLAVTTISLGKRGWTTAHLTDAAIDGFSAAQLPVGLSIAAGLVGLLDGGILATLMTASMVGLWAAALFIGLGCIAFAKLFRS